MRHENLLDAFARYQRQTERFLNGLFAQTGVSYRVTGISPSDVEFTASDWDGDDATAAAPNPSEDDDAPETLDAMHLLIPEGDDARESKANWKLPFREGPDAPVNENALTAAIAAINGARGGIDGVSRSALEAAHQTAVGFGIAAGIYDDDEDAPAFDPPTAEGGDPGALIDDIEACDHDHDDLDDGAQCQACGYVKPLPAPDVGAGAGSESVSASENVADDDPEPEIEVTAELSGTVSPSTVGATAASADHAQALAEQGDGLVGIVWGAGDHDLSLGGEPTPVHVPEGTIPETFAMLQEDVDAGDVTVGLDHADGDAPVLAETGLIDIAVARDVSLAADERHIVLTESDFKNEQAAEAHADGAFEGFDFSVVADVSVRTDDDGKRVTTDDGRVVLDATRIKRIDAVETGAVEAASIGTIPELAEQASAALDANRFGEVADALEASASQIEEHMRDFNNEDFDTDPDDLEAAKDELSAAANAVETLEGHAEAFEQVAAAHDVDVDDHDDVDAAAQAVVDAQTVDIRENIAEYEAALAGYDTDDDSIEDRAEELAGRSAAELKARRGDLAHEYNEAQARAAEKGRAVTQADKDGHSPTLEGSGQSDGDADDLALEAMGAKDRLESEDADMSPAEFIRARYDVDPGDFDRPGDLNAALYEAKASGGN